MNIQSTKPIRKRARQLLQRDPQAGRLVLLHTAVTLAVGLLVTALDFYLTQTIDASGGLAGLQKRSILQTAQSVLQLASSLLLPFWQLGILRAAMAFARRENATTRTLCAGFHRFGPLLRMMLLQGVVFMSLLAVCSYAISILLLSTPLGQPVMEILEPLLADTSILTTTPALDEATMEALTKALMPMMSIALLLFAGLSIPLVYRMRLCNYFLLEDERCGVLRAFGRSFKYTRGNAGALLRLDLSFWWFYLLDGICIAVAYCDTILGYAGITLPIPENAAFFLFYLLSLAMQLVLYRFAYGYLQTSRALAYDVLRTPQASE